MIKVNRLTKVIFADMAGLVGLDAWVIGGPSEGIGGVATIAAYWKSIRVALFSCSKWSCFGSWLGLGS